MKSVEITLFGGTGLIGTFLKEEMVKDSFFKKINFVTRKLFKSNHRKITNHIIDFSNYEEISNTIKNSDFVFSAIGTTQSKVNWNKDEYRKIDYDINSNIALACKKFKVKNFSLVSTAGAKYKSNNFYLNLKGEIEKNIISMNLLSTSIYRPSLLLGNRKDRRIGEKIAQFLMPKFSFLMPEIYKPIKAKNVAISMINVSKSIQKGHKIYHYREIIENS
tara:strand:+ start:427 stop:1083 length:657 start_codon:yes stop_codon:yes gene_type:complete